MPDAVPAPIQKIDARLAGLDPASLRYRVLEALRRFRSSWIDLGRLLNETVYGGDYREYGYDDFEVYCARELGLKKPTVQKLMISYNYMKKYERDRLEMVEDGEEPPAVPDYQTVALLDKVRGECDMPVEDAEELHRRAFTEGEADDEVEFRKELRTMLRPAMRDAEKEAAGKTRRQELACILRVARELRRRLSDCRSVPGGLRERLAVALTELEALD